MTAVELTSPLNGASGAEGLRPSGTATKTSASRPSRIPPVSRVISPRPLLKTWPFADLQLVMLASKVRRFRPLLVAPLAGLIAGAFSHEQSSLAALAVERSFGAAAIPLLAPAPYLSVDNDLPSLVRERLVRVQRDLSERARAAA